jgi:hypothetical protein
MIRTLGEYLEYTWPGASSDGLRNMEDVEGVGRFEELFPINISSTTLKKI